MFGFFRSKCPVNTHEKAWTELAYLSIRDVFGSELMVESAPITPQGDLSIPQPCDEPFVRELVSRICENMRVDVADFTIVPRAESETENSDPNRISFVAGQTIDPRHAVPALATRVSMKKLSDYHVRSTNPLLTDWVMHLLPSYCGLGLFAANAIGLGDPSVSDKLTSRVHAYSLALYAWYRREDRPEWASFLRPDAAEPFAKGLNYLRQTADSAFHPDAREETKYRAVQAIADDLRARNPSTRIVALIQASERSDIAAVQAEIEECLSHKDPYVRTQALRTIERFENVSPTTAEKIALALNDSSIDVRCSALEACRRHVKPDSEVVTAIGSILNERERRTSYSAIQTLKVFGSNSQEVLPDVLRSFKRAIVDCDWEFAECLADAIEEIANNPVELTANFFSNDEELLGHALSLFERGDEQPMRRSAAQSTHDHDRTDEN